MKFLGPLPPFMDIVRCALIEFIGTFALVLIGAGSVLALGPDASAGTLEVALAHGLVIAVMVSAVAHISGAHFNPAITFGFMVTRRISILLGLVYVIAQMGAAALAALLLKWIFPTNAEGSLGAPSLTTIDTGPGLVVEALMVFFLVWVVIAMTTDARNQYAQVAGIAIGLTLTAGMLFAAPLTGGAINPARAFGPQLVANVWSGWSEFWIWYVGPFAGAAIAALLYDELFLRQTEAPPARAAGEPRVAEVTTPPPPPEPPSDRPPA